MSRPSLSYLGAPLCLLWGCTPGGQNPAGAVAGRAFPVGVVVASPFSYRVAPRSSADRPEVDPQASCPVENGATPGCTPTATGLGGTPATDYALGTAQINELLRGSSPGACRFDPALLLAPATDARCYGPVVAYEGHPDAQSAMDPGASGQLPPGDVGMWREDEPGTGNACAAAQLNARLQGVSGQSLGALSGLASLVCVAVSNGKSLPSSGTLDLTAEMNGAAPMGVSFAKATLSHKVDGSGRDVYAYLLDFTFTPSGGGMGGMGPMPPPMGGMGPMPPPMGASGPVRARVDLTHVPDGDAAYLGRLSYRVGVPGQAPGCSAPESTINGSLRYQRRGEGRLMVEARAGSFCGRDANGLTDGLADPRKKFDPAREPAGWTGNFSLFLGDFDPRNLTGSYAYAWQAGPQDGNSRVLNATVSEPREQGEVARVFYGYGVDIASASGAVGGMICNWAGPQNRHELAGAAQYQSLAQDMGRGLFRPLQSRLRYAPTNRCEYDGTGAFRYDSDGDGRVDTDPAQPVRSELMALTDADGDGRPDEIVRSGFVLPTPPPNP